MSLIVVDVETDGEIPFRNSIVCFGAVVVDKKLNKMFYEKIKPISTEWNPEALAISGFTREEHETFYDPKEVFIKFRDWIKENSIGRPIFISDNLAFDWQWINWYFHYFLGENPFGYSGQRIGDKFHGFYNNPSYKWKKHRKTYHDHNPVNDARGNAEALIYLKSQGLNINI